MKTVMLFCSISWMILSVMFLYATEIKDIIMYAFFGITALMFVCTAAIIDAIYELNSK